MFEHLLHDRCCAKGLIIEMQSSPQAYEVNNIIIPNEGYYYPHIQDEKPKGRGSEITMTKKWQNQETHPRL